MKLERHARSPSRPRANDSYMCFGVVLDDLLAVYHDAAEAGLSRLPGPGTMAGSKTDRISGQGRGALGLGVSE